MPSRSLQVQGVTPVSTDPSSTREERDRPGSDLDRLIDLESKLKVFLAAARTRAAERVEAARREAEARGRGLGEELARRERELEARIEDEVAATTASFQARARARVKRFDEVPEERIQRLAREILERLARGKPR